MRRLKVQAAAAGRTLTGHCVLILEHGLAMRPEAGEGQLESVKPIGPKVTKSVVPKGHRVESLATQVPREKTADGGADRRCPGCGGVLVTWGPLWRCKPCGRNFG